MKTWNQLFTRHGFMVQEERANEFVCLGETEENLIFLMESLENASVPYKFEHGFLTIERPIVSEETWLKSVDFQYRGRGEGLWFRPGKEEPKVKELDTYVAGVVRQLNRLGLHTMYCCDGHDTRRPSIGFEQWVDMTSVSNVLQAIGVSTFHVRHQVISLKISRTQLLDLAEKMALVNKEWVNEDCEWIKKQLFLHQLEQCLSINGESGNESEIREYVIEQLNPHVDFLTVDRTGNILAQKMCGTGRGPTVLVNAHLDTVEMIEKGRKIVKEGSIWSSSEGILGADDRAGVTVLIELAKRLETLKFHGAVKFIFTVEEEVGLVGARRVDGYFLWDVDAAFVVDRRGTGDIVTSCGGYEPFCHENYGAFVEQIAITEGLEGWKCAAGGSSDTRVWAGYGIQSVNLSAGYQHEHTNDETLHVDACYETLMLLSGVFQHGRELERVVRELKRSDVKSNRIS
ncbi:M20/M25/M40 family metallo-hydrolase [Bacillus sp. CGMCC 1.16541]|uniref:M20/M25/M40 family metallo-hydrolase n=1 Tax=Bacillus sp. CGMCC 1.16541 TaxID=2185143 RepID=UPI000D73A4CF|nr:M20/M25/M40 family metallo-hydrolase [Bacillus sp. CGMCC 1.16541]